jgi:hypothetical protein
VFWGQVVVLVLFNYRITTLPNYKLGCLLSHSYLHPLCNLIFTAEQHLNPLFSHLEGGGVGTRRVRTTVPRSLGFGSWFWLLPLNSRVGFRTLFLIY